MSAKDISEIAEKSLKQFEGDMRNEFCHNYESSSQSAKPSTSSQIAVTSCHDYPTEFISSQQLVSISM
jgi:hypothetical protein